MLNTCLPYHKSCTQSYNRGMKRSQWWSALVAVAEGQGGLFTTAQAERAGASRPQLVDLVAAGTLERVQHGVYQLSGSPVDRWTRTRAAWLSLAPEQTVAERLADDPRGVISHRSAALLLGLGDLDADRVEVTVTARRRTRNPDVLIHRGHVSRDDWQVRAGLPVTTPVHTLATLAMAGIDAGHLASMARDVMLRHDVPARQLVAALEPAAARYHQSGGANLLDDLLGQAGAPVSAVDLAAAAAMTHLSSTIADDVRLTELIDQVSARVMSGPAWQQLVQDVSRTTSRESLLRVLEPLQQSSDLLQEQLARPLRQLKAPVLDFDLLRVPTLSSAIREQLAALMIMNDERMGDDR